MAGRALRWMTWAVALLALLSYGLYLALGLSGPPLNGPAQFTPDDAVWVLGQVLFAIVGAVVVSRRPKLPIGWLFCTAGLLGPRSRCSGWVRRARRTPGSWGRAAA